MRVGSRNLHVRTAVFFGGVFALLVGCAAESAAPCDGDACATSQNAPVKRCTKKHPCPDAGGGGDSDAGSSFDASSGTIDSGTTTDASTDPTAKPGPGNSGVPAGVTLAPYTGDCVITTAGTVVDAADVTCRLTIAAPDVTVRRSRLRQGFIVSETTRTTVEDSTSDAGVGISSSTSVTLRRNDIHGPSDGLHITSDGSAHCENILVENNWIHGPQIEAGDHYDVLQVRGVTNLTLRGNNLDAGIWVEVTEGGTNAVVFFEDANGGNDTCKVEGNWLNGGGYMIYTSAANASFTKNRVGRDAHFGLLFDPYVPFVEAGNVWDDDGTPVTFQP